jgi:phosphopantetheine adenylyltransferase
VGVNSTKTPIFSGDERIELLRSSLTADLGEHAGAAGRELRRLLVDYCHRAGHDVVVRGVRGGHDLDYEMPMAITNRSMLPELETVFFATAPEHAFNSSTLVKEILAFRWGRERVFAAGRDHGVAGSEIRFFARILMNNKIHTDAAPAGDRSLQPGHRERRARHLLWADSAGPRNDGDGRRGDRSRDPAGAPQSRRRARGRRLQLWRRAAH